MTNNDRVSRLTEREFIKFKYKFDIQYDNITKYGIRRDDLPIIIKFDEMEFSIQTSDEFMSTYHSIIRKHIRATIPNFIKNGGTGEDFKVGCMRSNDDSIIVDLKNKEYVKVLYNEIVEYGSEQSTPVEFPEDSNPEFDAIGNSQIVLSPGLSPDHIKDEDSSIKKYEPKIKYVSLNKYSLDDLIELLNSETWNGWDILVPPRPSSNGDNPGFMCVLHKDNSPKVLSVAEVMDKSHKRRASLKGLIVMADNKIKFENFEDESLVEGTVLLAKDFDTEHGITKIELNLKPEEKDPEMDIANCTDYIHFMYDRYESQVRDTEEMKDFAVWVFENTRCTLKDLIKISITVNAINNFLQETEGLHLPLTQFPSWDFEHFRNISDCHIRQSAIQSGYKLLNGVVHYDKAGIRDIILEMSIF